jgi:hypothetical protein
MATSASIDENLRFDGFCHIQKWRRIHKLSGDLVVHQGVENGKTSANTKDKHERNDKIDV